MDRGTDTEPDHSDFHHVPSNLSDNKIKIAIPWLILLLSTCILPVVLYFVLKEAAHQSLAVAIGVPAGIFGGISVITYIRRAWSLAKSTSESRPMNSGRWAFDYFQYNFTLGLIYVSALVSYATSEKAANPRIAALPLSLLVAQVCVQLLGVWIMSALGLAYPFTASSMKKGTRPIRPALYTIVEDIVAVDGGKGSAFRQAWNARFQRSPDTRALLGHLSFFWGCSGLLMSTAIIVAIFVVSNPDISWALGWTAPWVWAAIMSIITIIRAKNAMRREVYMIGS